MQHFMMTLLTCSVTMSVLVLLYLVVSPLLAKRYSEKGRYYAWLIMVMGLIIPFRPTFDHAIVKVAMPRVTTTPIIQTGNVTTLVSPAVNAASSPATLSIPWWQAASAVWLLGMIAFLAYHMIKHYRFVKLAEHWSEDIVNEQTSALFNRLKTEMRISKTIPLYLCSSVGSPMLIGFFNPRVLLPRDDFAQDALRFILKHELVHFKRKDLWYKYLVLAATAIHWFNPIIHLMAKAIAAGCELSCDAEVVRNTDGDTRLHYSETILGVVKYHSKLKTVLSTNFYGGKRGMKKRIFSIMDTSRKKTGAAILCCMLVLTLGTGMAFAANANPKDSLEPSAVSGPASYNAVAISSGSSASENTEEDIALSYEMYAPFGLIYRDEALFYQGDPVRLFEDWYAVGEGMYAGRSYFDDGGTVDVQAIRDFSQLVYNTDGSYDPGGRLAGVEAYSQAEFDARDLSDYYAEPATPTAETQLIQASIREEIRPYALQGESTAQANQTEGRTHTEMFEDYAAFGVTFDTENVNGGLGNIYFNGTLVKRFVDIKPDGGTFSCTSSDGGEISVRTVYDENGKLTGVEVIKD